MPDRDRDETFRQMMDILNLLTTAEYVAEDRRTQTRQRECEDTYLRALGIGREIEGVVHVAGTKGKGSTCAMVAALLGESGYRMGLYTSPHLHDVRERIRIGEGNVNKEEFEEAVEWCCEKLKGVESEDVPFPGYFRFMTLVALRVFRKADVDGMVLEVGIGGRYDPTNVVRRPWVCGITSIGMDHMELLGNTMEEIAWDKGGILKPDVPAFTVQQQPGVVRTLEDCAKEARTTIRETSLSDYDNWDDIREGHRLTGFQLENAALAVALAREYEQRSCNNRKEQSALCVDRLKSLQSRRLPAAYLSGFSKFRSVGRAQIIDAPLLPDDRDICHAEDNVRLYLDGAHTPESMSACADWIRSEWQKQDGRHLDFLLFNCHQLRDPHLLLGSLHDRLQEYQLLPYHVFFAPPLVDRDSLLPIPHKLSNLEWQKKQLTAWCSLVDSTRPPVHSIQFPSLEHHVADTAAIKRENLKTRADIVRSLPNALKWFGSVARSRRQLQVRVLVTGSLYFVADVLKLVDRPTA